MGVTFAVAGKGGTGKTTVAALMIRSLIERKLVPLLAVDADPNSNLGEALGLSVERSIGELQAETLKQIHDLPPGVPLSRHLEYELHQAIVEGEGVDLLVMGHGEGPGCYCAVNHILRSYFESLRSSYRFTVLDNEAGLEHLSRRVSHGIDVLLIVSTAHPIALRAAGRITRMADELELDIGHRYLILNNVRNGLSPRAKEEAKRTTLTPVSTIPFDQEIEEMNLSGCSVYELSAKSTSLQKISEILDKLLQKEESA
jgi:CO dehydrogenase maturation factor